MHASLRLSTTALLLTLVGSQFYYRTDVVHRHEPPGPPWMQSQREADRFQVPLPFLPVFVPVAAQQFLHSRDPFEITTELITDSGYPAETHHVQTEDGYILEMHRIPHGVHNADGQKKPMVFVQHGLLASSADWIISGRERALGYLLANLGYDVWLGNARGNTYSRRHVRYSPSDGKFWDFSWHEIGLYDLPAMIDYALNATGHRQTFYIGHSQGTTGFYVMCSERPEYNAKIRASISLAPIAHMSHATSPLLRLVAAFRGPSQLLLDLTGAREFLPSGVLLQVAGAAFCSAGPLARLLCTNVLFVLCGFNVKQLDGVRLPAIMAHSPAGASTTQILHYAQLIVSGTFGKFDHGRSKNLHVYKSEVPPTYNLSRVTAPVALFYSKNDWLSHETDVLRLYRELGNPIGIKLLQDRDFNHLDYVWGKYAHVALYNDVLALLMTQL